jgi:hypothetical protein
MFSESANFRKVIKHNKINKLWMCNKIVLEIMHWIAAENNP